MAVHISVYLFVQIWDTVIIIIQLYLRQSMSIIKSLNGYNNGYGNYSEQEAYLSNPCDQPSS